jgi:hypothetical protein
MNNSIDVMAPIPGGPLETATKAVTFMNDGHVLIYWGMAAAAFAMILALGVIIWRTQSQKESRTAIVSRVRTKLIRRYVLTGKLTTEEVQILVDEGAAMRHIDEVKDWARDVCKDADALVELKNQDEDEGEGDLQGRGRPRRQGRGRPRRRF